MPLEKGTNFHYAVVLHPVKLFIPDLRKLRLQPILKIQKVFECPTFFNSAAAEAFRHPPLAGGGEGVKGPQPITREPIATARRVRRQTTAGDKTLQMSTNMPISRSRVRSRYQRSKIGPSAGWTSRLCAEPLSS